MAHGTVIVPKPAEYFASIKKINFQLNVETNPSFTSSMIGPEHSRHFLNLSDAKPEN